jgi:hypothetical protein
MAILFVLCTTRRLGEQLALDQYYKGQGTHPFTLHQNIEQTIRETLDRA